MILKKTQLSSELKLGKVIKDNEDILWIEIYDKDKNLLGKETICSVFSDFLDKEFIKFKIEYQHEVV